MPHNVHDKLASYISLVLASGEGKDGTGVHYNWPLRDMASSPKSALFTFLLHDLGQVNLLL